MDPSQVLSSYRTKLHLHLLHSVQAGLNECNDQAVCRTLLFYSIKKKPKKTAPSRQGKMDIVLVNSLALIWSVHEKGFGLSQGKGGCCAVA